MDQKNSHYVRTTQNIEIRQILSGDTVPTGEKWDKREPEIRQALIWGAGPSANEIFTKKIQHGHRHHQTDKLIGHFMLKRNT